MRPAPLDDLGVVPNRDVDEGRRRDRGDSVSRRDGEVETHLCPAAQRSGDR